MHPVNLLTPAQFLQGTHLVSVSVRPTRTAYVVPSDDQGILTQVVQACTNQLGGMLNPIIPYERESGMAPTWLRILEKLDPDRIEDLAGLRDDDREHLESNGWYVHNSLGQRIVPTPLFPGTHVHSALTVAQANRSPTKVGVDVLVDPRIEESSDLFLPVIGRFGIIGEPKQPIAPILGRMPMKTLEDLIRVDAIALADDFQGALLGLNIHSPASASEGGLFDYHRAIDLTMLGLHQVHRRWRNMSSPISPTDLDAIVITGNPISVADFCLYWNLRMDRSRASPFPLLIPLQILESEWGESLIRRATNVARFGGVAVSERFPVQILSASIKVDEIRGALGQSGKKSAAATEDFSEYIDGRWLYTIATEEQNVLFSDGCSKILLPSNDNELLRFAALDDDLSYDALIDDVVLPGIYDLWRLSPPCQSGLSSRITGRGSIAGQVSTLGLTSHINVGVPSGWNLISALLERKGYQATPTSDSSTAAAIMELIGQSDEGALLSSSMVYEFLRQMSYGSSEHTTKPRRYLSDRKTFTVDALKSALGDRHLTNVVMDALIRRRLLLRGLELKCPNCQMKRWYPLDRITDVWRCDGCLALRWMSEGRYRPAETNGGQLEVSNKRTICRRT